MSKTTGSAATHASTTTEGGTQTIPHRPHRPGRLGPSCGSCNKGEHHCTSERCSCREPVCVKARERLAPKPVEAPGGLHMPPSAPKPGDPDFKVRLSEPPGKGRGSAPLWKRCVPGLEELREHHPGEWGCICTWPPDAEADKNTSSRANSLVSGLRKGYADVGQFELAGRLLDDGGCGVWARYKDDQ